MTGDFQGTEIYLKYADDVEKCDPIMAAACRFYYVQSFISQTKCGGSQIMSNQVSAYMNTIISNIEKTHKASGLTPEQRKARVNRYCTLMYNKIVDDIKTPGADKLQSLDRLTTMVNFIQVMTVFGPLEPVWVENCKLCVKTRQHVQHAYRHAEEGCCTAERQECCRPEQSNTRQR
eukprot:TRINITY_DN2072_c0_g1_i7.p1 TRINITY_DN2072_c0_g1~~TRINITY_DN2072_c0_g1_i7.p1  ORF type:complete len:176 (+),score=20.89 TRINITY_DN2072_c0_g1_i7:147-674(+)